MCSIVFAYDEKSSGISVNPMNDAGAHNTVDPGEAVTAMVKQSVDQR